MGIYMIGRNIDPNKALRLSFFPERSVWKATKLKLIEGDALSYFLKSAVI